MNSATTRPTLRQIRAAARAALDAANHYGLAADDALAHPGDPGALRNAAEVLGACDAALSLGSAAPMAVAS